MKELDHTEAKILRMLQGWDIASVECLLIHRVIPEAKRCAKLSWLPRKQLSPVERQAQKARAA